ncbi:hypothetical protein DPMN_098027 [Dreissena polymorpha]|uniref:Uncharacterized protein n=1 Tax=Dreissena polymorpha TaxID=45954 RepID=A0A9D4LC95_DREPO|nr:hypothetical protein DPMN_098027 [Dreissena polymorpha]
MHFSLQLKHVHSATAFGDNQMWIRLEAHKTAHAGRFTYLQMPRSIYDMLLGYCKLVLKDETDGEQYVFGNGEQDARNCSINRWLQKAWAK